MRFQHDQFPNDAGPSPANFGDQGTIERSDDEEDEHTEGGQGRSTAMFRPPTSTSAAAMEESTNAILDNNTLKKSAVNNGKYNNLMGKKNSSTFGVKSQSTITRPGKGVSANHQNPSGPGSF